jgi:Leucine-rich repeat (LRR) protein
MSINSIELTREQIDELPLRGPRDILVVWEALGRAIQVTVHYRHGNISSLMEQFDAWIAEHNASLQQVQTLDLSHRLICTLPRQIGRISQLRELYLQNNRLLTLPQSMRGLSHLTHLDVSHNMLVELDPEMNHATLRHLNVGYNQLAFIPTTLCRLHPECFLNAENNPLLSPEEIQSTQLEIQQNPNGGPIFFATLPRAPHKPASLDHWLKGWLKAYQETFPQLCTGKEDRFPLSSQTFLNFYDTLRNHDKKGFLQEFLKRLTNTQDFKNDREARNNLIYRVGQMLQEAAINEEFREAIFPILETATSTCGDRVALAFNEIEIQLHLSKSHEKTDQQLATILIGVKRLELLRNCVHTRCKELGLGDEIEIQLFYQLKLKEALNLPTSTQNMLYPGTASAITFEMLEKDAKTVWSQTHSAAHYVQLLLQYPVWCERMKKNHLAQFGAINLAISDKITEVMDKKLPPEESKKLINALEQEQKTKTQALIESLTSEWVEKNL